MQFVLQQWPLLHLISKRPKPRKHSEVKLFLLGSEFPDYLTDGKNLTADISLMLNNKNELIVVSTSSNKESLDNFLKSKLNYQKINVKGLKKGQIYKVPFTIKQS